MTGKDLIAIIDQQRVVKPEPFDAAGDLLDLLGRMGTGVTRVGPQRVGRPVFEVHKGPPETIRVVSPKNSVDRLHAVMQNRRIIMIPAEETGGRFRHRNHRNRCRFLRNENARSSMRCACYAAPPNRCLGIPPMCASESLGVGQFTRCRFCGGEVGPFCRC